MKKLLLILVLFIFCGQQSAMAKYYGQFTVNKYEKNSITNPYSKYSNPYSKDSIFNPFNNFYSNKNSQKITPINDYNRYRYTQRSRKINSDSPLYEIIKEYPQRNYHGETLKLYDATGQFRGNLNNDKYDYNSISNPHGPYGNPHAINSIHNPYGAGYPYQTDSPFNPHGSGWQIHSGRPEDDNESIDIFY